MLGIGGYTGPFPAFTFVHLFATDTGTLRVGARCLLHSVNVNQSGANGNILKLYDAGSVGAAGVPEEVAVIDVSKATVGQSFTFDCLLPSGLVTRLENGTPADVTLTFAVLP